MMRNRVEWSRELDGAVLWAPVLIPTGRDWETGFAIMHPFLLPGARPLEKSIATAIERKRDE